eukprot:2728114-Prymnesium_polylepis.1
MSQARGRSLLQYANKGLGGATQGKFPVPQHHTHTRRRAAAGGGGAAAPRRDARRLLPHVVPYPAGDGG